MSILNPLAREISAKIVYYGPGLSGKTTSLHAIYGAVRKERRGELVSLATETDRTIFFDFLPLHVERVRGLGVRFQLYTVPGQVFYGATRKLVLTGADGVVFVADSQPECHDANLESFDSLRSNIAELGYELGDFPLVFQYNKRDLPSAVPVRELSQQLNSLGAPEFPSCATSGQGVIPALREITKLAIKSLTDQQPAVRRQIVDGDDRDRTPPMGEGIAHSVYQASRSLGAYDTISSRDTHPTATETESSSAATIRPGSITPSAEKRLTPQPPPGRLSFGRFWPEDRVAAVHAIEHAIAAGDHAKAVRDAARMLAELLESLPGPSGGADPGTKAALLGLDGRDYLRLCRLATLPAEALSEIDALLSLHVLNDAQLKLSRL